MIVTVAKLIADAEIIGVTLTEQQAKLLQNFIDEVLKWNRAYNLTAITDPTEVYLKHLLDSLSIAPYLQGRDILDVGTGAGFPGIPLAITKPDSQFTLLDSNSKKIRFINHFCLTSGMKNVVAIHSRIEQFKPDHAFDTIISRAFSDIASTLKLVDHLWSENTQVLFMKGPNFQDELPVSPSKAQWDIHPVEIPGLQAERYVLRFIHQ